jgi:hypothetical protein
MQHECFYIYGRCHGCGALEPKGEASLSPAPCSAGASAINDVEEWRIACNWKSTDPEWDATLKTVIAFAREGQRLTAQPNDKLTGGANAQK